MLVREDDDDDGGGGDDEDDDEGDGKEHQETLDELSLPVVAVDCLEDPSSAHKQRELTDAGCGVRRIGSTPGWSLSGSRIRVDCSDCTE